LSPAQAAVRLRPASWQDDRAGIESVRRRVFIEEQAIPEADEWDDVDPRAQHVLAFWANRDAVGTGRVDPLGKIGRVAVLPQYRGRGIGAAIMGELVRLARDAGLDEVHLNAQASATGFYERLGFRPEGPEFDEVGIPHRRMRRRIERENDERDGRDGHAMHPVDAG
jgi:predicted GNAT family N-acyltransferase